MAPGHAIEGGLDREQVDGKTNEEGFHGVSEVVPHPVDAEAGGPPQRVRRVARHGNQVLRYVAKKDRFPVSENYPSRESGSMEASLRAPTRRTWPGSWGPRTSSTPQVPT